MTRRLLDRDGQGSCINKVLSTDALTNYHEKRLSTTMIIVDRHVSWMIARQPEEPLQGQLQVQLETGGSPVFITVHPACRVSLACNKDNCRTQSQHLRPNPFLIVCKPTRVLTTSDWTRQTRPVQTRELNPEKKRKMSEAMNHLGHEPRDIDMRPTLPPPPVIDLNTVYEQVTWLTKELEALQHENE